MAYYKKYRVAAGLAAVFALASGAAAPAHGAPLAHHATRARSIQPAAATLDDATPVGERIVAFARANQGRAVGDGECYDLADQALRRAGARSAPDYGRITADADYVWGDRVALQDARPGDIVQFRGFTVKTTVVATERLPDGRPVTSESWVTETRDHHTAIVERNLGGRLQLLEQNVEPALVVQHTLVALSSMTMRGMPDGTPGDATTTFEVAGAASIYRPRLEE